MELLIINVYIFILAAVLAILEIQIEGEHGWAKNLPTWRPHPDSNLSKVYKRLMSGRDLTGYHLTMFAFVFLIFHFPYVFGLTFILEHWLKTMSYFFIFVVLWDFLWFVLNPHYPLRKFTAEHIWWHKKWGLGLPIDYYGGVVISLLVLMPIIYLSNSSSVIIWWGMNIGLFLFQTLVLIVFSRFILDIE